MAVRDYQRLCVEEKLVRAVIFRFHHAIVATWKKHQHALDIQQPLPFSTAPIFALSLFLRRYDECHVDDGGGQGCCDVSNSLSNRADNYPDYRKRTGADSFTEAEEGGVQLSGDRQSILLISYPLGGNLHFTSLSNVRRRRHHF